MTWYCLANLEEHTVTASLFTLPHSSAPMTHFCFHFHGELFCICSTPRLCQEWMSLFDLPHIWTLWTKQWALHALGFGKGAILCWWISQPQCSGLKHSSWWECHPLCTGPSLSTQLSVSSRQLSKTVLEERNQSEKLLNNHYSTTILSPCPNDCVAWSFMLFIPVELSKCCMILLTPFGWVLFFFFDLLQLLPWTCKGDA